MTHPTYSKNCIYHTRDDQSHILLSEKVTVACKEASEDGKENDLTEIIAVMFQIHNV